MYLCVSICRLMSLKGLKSGTELFVDAAFGNNQYGPKIRGCGACRQVSGSAKDECITASPVQRVSVAENSNTNGGGSKEPHGGDQNGARSNAGGPNLAGNKVGFQKGSTGQGSNGGGINETMGQGNDEGRVGGSNSLPLVNAKTASTSKLHALVQHIYAAQARVQLEAAEIKKAQAVASAAQKSLEEASNNVRVITAALQAAQQAVAAAAVRAQTAQLQLAAHDQLLFAARQKVDALSAQMVGLQAEEGIMLPHTPLSIQSLFDQLREPLSASKIPTPIPPVDNPPTVGDIGAGDPKNDGGRDIESRGIMDYEDYYVGEQ